MLVYSKVKEKDNTFVDDILKKLGYLRRRRVKTVGGDDSNAQENGPHFGSLHVLCYTFLVLLRFTKFVTTL